MKFIRKAIHTIINRWNSILGFFHPSPPDKVETSLYRRALEYEARYPAKDIIKEALPDVLAAIFWLKNRDPKRWKNLSEEPLIDRFDRAHRALQEVWKKGGEKTMKPRLIKRFRPFPEGDRVPVSRLRRIWKKIILTGQKSVNIFYKL